jgi:hypothetical protein
MSTESACAKACNRAATFAVSPRTVTSAALHLPTMAAPVLRPIPGCGRSPRDTRRVFEWDRGPEDRHDAVAGKALHHAALLAFGFVHTR